MIPQDYYASDGQPIRPKLRALARLVVDLARLSISGGNVRVHDYLDGKVVVEDTAAPVFRGSWKVEIAGPTQVRVGVGRVQGDRVPRLDDVYLDGIDARGDEVPRPTLDCKSGPGEGRRSYVSLAVSIGGDGELDEDALTVVHQSTYTPQTPDGQTGYKPLAELVWNVAGTSIQRVSQIAYFDYAWRYAIDVGEKIGRHEFVSTE